LQIVLLFYIFVSYIIIGMREINKKINFNGFSLLGELLTQQFDKAGLGKKIAEYKAITAWENIAGKRLAGHTEAVDVKNKHLIVKVDSPILRNELTFLKPRLLEKLIKEAPESGVKDIIFR